MTSTTFSDDKARGFGAMFAWQLRRGLPLGITYGAVLLAANLLGFNGHHSESFWLQMMGVIAMAMALLLPVTQFGACFSRRKADFTHALPVSRGAFYWGTFCSALLWLWGPLPFAAGIHSVLLTNFSAGMTAFLQELSAFLLRLLFLLVMSGACLALFTLAAVGSGSYFEYGLNSLLLSVCWPVCFGLFRVMVSYTVPNARLALEVDRFSHLIGSPPVSMFLMSYGIPVWWLLWFALFGGLLAAAGGFLYRRRPSEAAGSFYTAKPLEYVVRTLLGAGAAFAVGTVVPAAFQRLALPETPRVPLTVFAMALSLPAGWLLTELLYRRGLKKLSKHFRFLAAPAALCVVLTAVMATGMGLDAAVPKQEEILYADAIEWLRHAPVGYASVVIPGTGETGITLIPRFSDPEQVEKVLELQKKAAELEREIGGFPYLPGRAASNGPASEHEEYLTIEYRLENGEYFYRSFSFDKMETDREKALYEEMEALLRELNTSEEAISAQFPVCAIDAAEGIAKATVLGEDDPETDEIYSNSYKDLLYSVSDPPKKEKKIDSLGKDFREKLEKALRDDLTHERCPSGVEIEEKYGGSPTEIYEIYYPAGKRFTARGGILENTMEPAAGREWTLYRYADDRYRSWGEAFRVWPEMTETYELLSKVVISD